MAGGCASKSRYPADSFACVPFTTADFELAEITSERAWGPDGYLSDRGLIPMPDFERGRTAATVTLLGELHDLAAEQ